MSGRLRSLSKSLDKLVDGGSTLPRHCHPQQILLESCGFRPQNLQGSDFSYEKSATWPPYMPPATIKIREGAALSSSPVVF